MKVTKEDIGVFRVVAIRHIGPYHLIGEKFGQLGQAIAKHQIPMMAMLGLFHDDPSTVPAGELRSDAAAIVPNDYELPEGTGLQVMDVPAATYAKYSHYGSYAGLPSAWESFVPAVSEAGYTMTPGAAMEIYRNDCSKVPENEVHTDLYVPVA